MKNLLIFILLLYIAMSYVYPTKNPCNACLFDQKCVFGKCIPDDNVPPHDPQIPAPSPYRKCLTNDQCGSLQTCYAYECRDKKIVCNDRCGHFYQCINQRCEPRPAQFECYAQYHCKRGQNCVNKKCTPIGTGNPLICQKNYQCGFNEQCISGFCKKTCSQCPPNSKCLHGQCLPLDYCNTDDDCSNNLHVCLNNKCDEPQQKQVCPWTGLNGINAHSCRQNRPTSCPQIFYFRAPDIGYCGITRNGTKINYVQSCDACLNTEVIQYFDVPCGSVPLLCSNSQTCLLQNGYSYCSKNVCKADGECPYDWQFCEGGRCLDSCLRKGCPNCKYGICQYQQISVSQTCVRNVCRRDYWTCFNRFQCLDFCTKSPCPPYHRCQKGYCIKE